MARCTGLKRDLRMMKLETYANYYHLNFRAYTGQNGDSYDRYLIRMNEMMESLFIINQVLFKLTSKRGQKASVRPLRIVKQLYPKLTAQSLNKHEYTSMERLIKHFKY
jgi:NADH-quinone oxidoreductase subunit D